MYGVWFNIEGLWVEVVVDDRLPFIDVRGELLLAGLQSSDHAEIWPSILEKAYFQALEAAGITHRQEGIPFHTLRDLTGAPYTIYKNFQD